MFRITTNSMRSSALALGAFKRGTSHLLPPTNSILPILASRRFATKESAAPIKETYYKPYSWVTEEAECLIAKAYNRHKALADSSKSFPPSLSFQEKADLEKLEAPIHYQPKDFIDRAALNLMRFLRVFTHAFFRKKYDHHAVVLETVAAVPGIVAAFHRHLRSLRRMERDHGWINPLLEEAENERMHLLIWMTMIKPSKLERGVVILAQGTYLTFYSLLYFVNARAAHRMVGYLEEEAHMAYTAFLKAIDDGEIPNKPAPEIAKRYYRLPADATLRDVVLCVRADECMHRDFNHMLGEKHYHKRINESPDFMRADLRVEEAFGPDKVYKEDK